MRIWHKPFNRSDLIPVNFVAAFRKFLNLSPDSRDFVDFWNGFNRIPNFSSFELLCVTLAPLQLYFYTLQSLRLRPTTILPAINLGTGLQ